MLTYLISRYAVFFLQFVFSLLLATKLDPYHLGIWSFVLLILNYINQFDFGISHAFNVFLSQSKDDFKETNSYFSNSLFLVILLGILVITICILTFIFPSQILVKYDIHYKIILIGIIGALQYVNNLFMALYRINGSFKEITVNQSINVVLSFLIFFVDENYQIINALFIIYIASNLVSLSFYMKNSSLNFKWEEVNKDNLYLIINKAVYLFLFNSSTYLIIISTRSFISNFYSVSDFGVFSLAYSLANAFFLFISTIGFIIYPTILSSFTDSSRENLVRKYRMVNKKYLLASHLILYLSIPVFFISKDLFKNYDGLFENLSFISLALLVNAHSYTSTTLLVAMKKELNVAIFSILALFINLIGCFFVIHFLKVEFKYVIFITTLSNLILVFLCGILVNRKLIRQTKKINIIGDIFPMTLLLPYLVYLAISILGLSNLFIFPIALFLFINRLGIREIFQDALNYFKIKQFRL